MRFPIHLSYDPAQPIGWVEIDDDVSHDHLASAAIVPAIVKGTSVEVKSFGLIPRKMVDIRPDPDLGET